MSDSALPLAGLTVLDLTQARAGPTAARVLADWGANVIYIEPPMSSGKNKSGGLTGLRDGFDFQNLHRNKRSVTINLKEERGHALFMRMASKADVIVENFRADVKNRLGIDYDSIKAVNPRIVYGSISGFGQDGPYSKRPGVDQIAQALGGLMSITGLPGQAPEIRVSRITPVAVTREGRNLFEVEASLLQTPPQALRPGMQGVGKIVVGDRKLIWIWTHKITEWLRMFIWSWWP